jgi:AraC-like DNA-binding protein
MTVAEPGWIVSSRAMRFWGLWVRRSDLCPLVAGLEDRVLQQIATDTEPMRYLIGYVRHLEKQQTLPDPDLARIVAVHLRDLFVLALGATRDAALLAEGRGLRAARLQAIKRHIADDLGERGLTVGTVAARHGVGTRYVQRLFDSEGTTFSEYVLKQRLLQAFRMLGDARYVGWTVSAIALEAGFGDVSYFNRRFRRCFGAPPTHFRSGDGEAHHEK